MDPDDEKYFPAITVSVALLIAAVTEYNSLLPIQHDYGLYLVDWEAILRGVNPWLGEPGKLNGHPYGPLYTYLAWLTLLDPKLPRLLFALAYIIPACLAVVSSWRRYGPVFVPTGLLLGLFLFSPYFYFCFIGYGTFDSLVAVGCVLALWAYCRERDFLAGTFLAIATLFKFYPVLLLPLLAFDRQRRFRVRFVVVFLLLVIGVIIVTGMQTDWAILVRLKRTMVREARVLSFFGFLSGPLSPLRVFTNNPNVDWLSIPTCVAVNVGLWVATYRYRLPKTIAAFLTLTLTMVTFKLGHIHFFGAPLMVLYCGLLFESDIPRVADCFRAGSLLAVFLCLVAATFYYALASIYVENLICLLSTIITALVAIRMFKLTATRAI